MPKKQDIYFIDETSIPTDPAKFLDFIDPAKGAKNKARFSFLAKCYAEYCQMGQGYEWPNQAEEAFKTLSKLSRTSVIQAQDLFSALKSKAAKIVDNRSALYLPRKTTDESIIDRQTSEPSKEKTGKMVGLARNWLPKEELPKTDRTLRKKIEADPKGWARKILDAKKPNRQDNAQRLYNDIMEAKGWDENSQHLATDISNLLLQHPKALKLMFGSSEEAAQKLMEARRGLNLRGEKTTQPQR